MTEFGTILLSLGLVSIFYLGRLKHRPEGPRWVRNPLMNLVVWTPFLVAVVGFVIAFNSLLDAEGGTTVFDELVSILVLGCALVLSWRISRKPRNVPA